MRRGPPAVVRKHALWMSRMSKHLMGWGISSGAFLCLWLLFFGSARGMDEDVWALILVLLPGFFLSGAFIDYLPPGDTLASLIVPLLISSALYGAMLYWFFCLITYLTRPRD